MFFLNLPRILMKKIILLSLFTIISFVTSCSLSDETAKLEPYKTDIPNKENAKPKTNKNLVLVELFTSEG